MAAINKKDPGDYGYVAFYNGKRIELYAHSSYTARVVAEKHFKAKDPHNITIMVAEKPDGTSVVHVPDF